MSEGRRATRVRVEGRVQGVAFRAWTVREAVGLGLDGWVRNRMDGSVEAVFAGAPEAVDDMVRRVGKGPRAARVDRIEREPVADPGPIGFSQRETG